MYRQLLMAMDRQRCATLQVESASQELEELREMKEDVERRERAQATVIENQAKRLDELETLYKVRHIPLTRQARLMP